MRTSSLLDLVVMLLISVLLKCLHSRKKVKRRRIKAPADDSSSTEGGQLECSGKVRYHSSEYWLYFDTFALLSLKKDTQNMLGC
jgi:hypothetical protein